MKKNIALTEAEEKLAELIWQTEVKMSPELVTAAEEKLAWKKSTTYTVLKKLCDKGLVENKNAKLTILLSKDDFAARQSRNFVEDAFGGSLPKFITAFFGGKNITKEEADELKRLINDYERSSDIASAENSHTGRNTNTKGGNEHVN